MPETFTDPVATVSPSRTGHGVLDDASWLQLVNRLNEQSLTKRHDTFIDIDWDDPNHHIDRHDPRWVAAGEALFGRTEWWARVHPRKQARIGLHVVATRMRSGLIFENVLSRGLLAYAVTLPNGSSEFRYAYHEVIEESQHTLMFQEFVNRSGYVDTGRLPLWARMGINRVIGFATSFPELFFVFVLGGEDPIDHVQREGLKAGVDHPLLERIMRIHVIEEARHLSFARHQFKRSVHELGRVRRTALRYTAPLVLAIMADQMLGVPPHLVKKHDIPARAVAEVRQDPERQADIAKSLGKVRSLLEQCGLTSPGADRLWRRLRLAPD